LSIVQARRAPVAVLLRRGPTRWVQLIRWDTANDTFELGQWLHGRVYEWGCDLSDNGELMTYVARKGGQRTLQALGEDTWTAICRPPYLTALALWPHNGLGGGGCFLRGGRFWLNLPEQQRRPMQRAKGFNMQIVGSEQLGDKDRKDEPQWRRVSDEGVQPAVWRRLAAEGALALEGTWQPIKRPFAAERHLQHCTLENSHGKHEIAPAEFVDFDRHGRVITGRGGELWVCDQPAAAQLDWRLLADFSGLKPGPKAAPEWATQWPYQVAR
jgi:hypothetical protein